MLKVPEQNISKIYYKLKPNQIFMLWPDDKINLGSEEFVVQRYAVHSSNFSDLILDTLVIEEPETQWKMRF